MEPDRFMDAYEAYEAEREAAWSRRLYAAIMLSPTLEVCRALLLGEPVPRDRLDQDALRRLGR